MEIEDIIHDLKTKYMVDMASLWHKSGKVDEDAGILEVGNSDGPSENDIRNRNDFLEYLQLEIMPHRYVLRLISCLVNAASLDLKNIGEEIGLERRIYGLIKCAETRI
jgi:hypothetical protein